MQNVVAKKSSIITFVALTAIFVVFYFYVPIAGAESQLETKINSAGESVMSTLKDLAKIVTVIVLALMGYSYFLARSAEGLADMKGRLGLLFACLFFILGGEWVYDFVAGLFA